MINVNRLRECLDYNPETGIFHWKISTMQRIKVGDVAGGLFNGYIRIGIDGKIYRAHRLAWLYMTGEWPDDEIDHIDGNRSNNPILNLRDVPININRQNQRKAQITNKAGFLGVIKRNKKFMAKIMVDGVRKYLGTFETAEMAHEAYLKAKRIHHEGCVI